MAAYPKTVALSRDAIERYCTSFNRQRAPTALPTPSKGWHSEVGVDLGFTTFVTLSTGEKIQNPRHLQRRLKALRRNQRQLARRQHGAPAQAGGGQAA